MSRPPEPPPEPPSPGGGELVSRLRVLVDAAPALRALVTTHATGEALLREGEANEVLFVLLEGEVALFKAAAGEAPLRVSTHGPGDILGVNSVATGQPAFTTARVLRPTRCLALAPEALARLPAEQPELHGLLQRLTTANLADRYRSAVTLQLNLARANAELTETRNQLVHREKMAVLGQLVAGLAHELNNPAAALARQRDHVAETLAGLCAHVLPEGWRDYWTAGETAPPAAGDPAARVRLERLESARPDLPRALLRRLAALPEALAAPLLPPRGATQPPPPAAARLAVFELAYLLHSQRAATAQISHLVASLKTYARPASSSVERIDLRENIEGTLRILGPALEGTELGVDLQSGLGVKARPGDLSQVWTNLIRNALEAAGPGKPLRVVARPVDGGAAEVAVIDRGPGVPPALREKIFELNYTTKTGRENFGLGLGLSITSSLVAQHGGELRLEDTPGGGATFVVRLPLAAPAS